MSIFRISARRMVVYVLLLLASVHIDAAAARALIQAPSAAVVDDAVASESIATERGDTVAATLYAARTGEADAGGAVSSKTCQRTSACAGYIVPVAPPLAVPAPVRDRHRQVVWQAPAPVAIARLTPPPR